MADQLYSKVPWLGPQDLEPMGEPAVIRYGGETAHVLRIPSPFGRSSDVALAIVESPRTGVLTAQVLADSGVPELTPVQNVQRNQNRTGDTGED